MYIHIFFYALNPKRIFTVWLLVSNLLLRVKCMLQFLKLSKIKLLGSSFHFWKYSCDNFREGEVQIINVEVLKGQLHGRAEIFNGLKMTFRTKILKKKLYHANQRKKYYKLCFDNFSLGQLFYFDCALDRSQAQF